MKKIIFGAIALALSANMASAMNYNSVTTYLTTIQAYENVCIKMDGNKSKMNDYFKILEDIKAASGPTMQKDAMSESIISGAALSKKVIDSKKEKQFCDIANKSFTAYEELGNL